MCVSFLSCAADVIETVMHSFNWVNHILSSILHIAETHNVRNGETFWSPRQEVEGYNRKWACLVKKNQLTSNMHELLSFTEQTVPSQLHTQHCHIRTLSHTPVPAPSFSLFSFWLKEDEFLSSLLYWQPCWLYHAHHTCTNVNKQKQLKNTHGQQPKTKNKLAGKSHFYFTHNMNIFCLMQDCCI